MRKHWSRGLSMVLAAAMIMGLVPVSVFAGGSGEMMISEHSTDIDNNAGSVVDVADALADVETEKGNLLENEAEMNEDNLTEEMPVESVEGVSANAGEEPANLGAGAIAGTCGDGVTWYYDASSKTLTISGNGEMTDYSSANDQPWRSYWSKIEHIVVKKGVKKIGSHAFGGYSYGSYEKSIELPEGLNHIGNYAFDYVGGRNGGYCEQVRFPSTLKYIGDYAFQRCSMMSGNLILPDGLEYIGSYAFYNCNNLSKVYPMSRTFSFLIFLFSDREFSLGSLISYIEF